MVIKKTSPESLYNSSLQPETQLVYAGRQPHTQYGFINCPIYKGSTVLFDSYTTLKTHNQPYTYGTHGCPTTNTLTQTLCLLDEAAGAELQPSGLTSITLAILSFCYAQAHILIVDSAYEPTRTFCENFLVKMGIIVEYYDPLIGADIASLIRPQTCLVFAETPGSNSFEIQDIDLLSQAVKKVNPNTIIIVDNTWSSSVYFKPLKHGADVVVHALTKYASGGSDILMGAVTANEKCFPSIQKTQSNLGLCVAPADAHDIQKSMRSLIHRLRLYETSAFEIAHWLEKHPQVERVLHPGLKSHPQHELFIRDFTGSSGLFSFVCKERLTETQIGLFCDHLNFFGMGYSWGGFESLILPVDMMRIRSVTAEKWRSKGTVFRLNIGLESTRDLITDLEAAFKRIQHPLAESNTLQKNSIKDR